MTCEVKLSFYAILTFLLVFVEDSYIDDDYELSGQLFLTDSYAVSELLADVKDSDETKPSVTDSAESATLSSTQVSISGSSGSNKLHTIVLYLAGQQASGVQALINVQCLVHSLDLPVVFLEPVIVQNKFKAMPLVQYNISGNSMTRESLSSMVVHFSDLFDLDVFNKFSSEMNYAQVAPRDVFFASAPRKIVLVHLFQGSASKTPRLMPLWPQGDSPAGAGGCFDPMKSDLDPSPKDQLRLLALKGFCVFKAVVYRVEGGGRGLIFSEAELRESVLGDLPYSDFTLVFSLWMPKFVLPGTKGLQCLHSGYHSAKGQFQPSQRLLQNAQYYKEHFLNSTRRGYLTLMIRLEHLYVSPRKGWTVTRCLDAAIAKIKEFQTERNFGKPFVTLDIGRYGSRSLRRNLGLDNVRRDLQYISELLSSVYGGQWNMREWENSFIEATGGIIDSSYIAALQRTLASRAECLVLVGGGMFQELTLRKYLETRNINDRCIHLLCLKNDINSEIAKS